jgi:hypothetical protein
LLAVALVLTVGARGSAQTDLQLWGEFTIDWTKSSRLLYGLDFEPQVLLSPPATGKPGWWTMQVTPSVDYAATNWMDLTGELVEAYTKQTNDQNSIEITPRAGIRFHLLSRDLPTLETHGLAARERPPRRRVSIRDYVRVELRNIFYSEGMPASSHWRFRNRPRTAVSVEPRQDHRGWRTLFLVGLGGLRSAWRSHRAVCQPRADPGRAWLSAGCALAARGTLHLGQVA